MQAEEQWETRRRQAAHTFLRRVAAELQLDAPVEVVGSVSGRTELGRVWFRMTFRGAIEGEMIVAIAGLDSISRGLREHRNVDPEEQISALRLGFREALNVLSADFGLSELGEFRPARANEVESRVMDQLTAARCGGISMWFGLSCTDAKFEVAQLQARLRRAEATAANALRSARRSLAQEEASWTQRSRVLERMSRRVRTPLANVLGSVELLLDGERDAQRRALLEAIAESSESILRVVDDLDDMALIDAGEVVRDRTPIDLTQMIEQLASRLLPSAQGRQIRLKYRAEKSPMVVGDATRLRQALLQLGRRMIDYTTRARVDINLTLRPQVDETVVAEIELSDGGESLKPATARLEPGSAKREVVPHERDKSEQDANDLNVEVCRRLVEAMGGELRMDTLPNGLLRYSISVAFPKHTEDEKTASRSSRSARPVTSTTLSEMTQSLAQANFSAAAPTVQASAEGEKAPIRVLLAEDDSVSRMVVARMLKKLGFDVGLAENGAEALKSCQEEAWDLVLMDLDMPLLDGLSATQKIRRDSRSKARATPILALTAAPEADEKARCIAAGMDGYLTKPVRLQEIKREIERFTGMPRRIPNTSTDRVA
jgi:CheY-like chemotaxis protein